MGVVGVVQDTEVPRYRVYLQSYRCDDDKWRLSYSHTYKNNNALQGSDSQGTKHSASYNARPRINKISNAVPVDGHILLGDHLNDLLGNEPPEERRSIREVCERCANAKKKVNKARTGRSVGVHTPLRRHRPSLLAARGVSSLLLP